MIKVSIVVPVYNAEKYLEECFNSLANQTLENIEIIAVNDGSKDNSQKIINEYVNKYPNKFVGIKKNNGGPGDARNYGIAKANGEYIAFVDSDDYIDTTMYEKMYNKAKTSEYDIVCCNVKAIYPSKAYSINSGIDKDITEKKMQTKEKLLIDSYAIVCNKIFKSKILKEVKIEKNGLFKKNVWFEDVLFLYKLYPYINTVGVVDESLYYYPQRENSITYTYNDKLNDILDNMDDIVDYYKEKKYYEENKEILEYVYAKYCLATYTKRLAKCKNYKKYKNGCKVVICKVKEKFPDYKKNKYLKKASVKNIYIKYFNPIFSNVIYFYEKNKMN